jgi:hypothetical protein
MSEDTVSISKSDIVKHAASLRMVASALRSDGHKIKADVLDDIANNLDPIPPSMQKKIAEYLWPDDWPSGMPVAKNIINLMAEALRSLNRYDNEWASGMSKYPDGDYVRVNDLVKVLGIEDF